jgi:hypothetical protein
MTPDDFPQFDDPRVREVMAAAANLVDRIAKETEEFDLPGEGNTFDQLCDDANTLSSALFAAQHSVPRKTYPCACHLGDPHHPWCERAEQHSRPETIDEVTSR